MELTQAQQALLSQRLKGRGAPAIPRIPAAPDGPTLLSAEQEQIVHHSLLAPGNPIYNECITLVHRGTLDVAALRTALDALVARYDVWHSQFRRTRRLFHQVVVDAPRFELPVHDLRGTPTGALEELVAEVALAPYDLTGAATVRPLLVRVADHEHRLYLALHHIVFDGVSLYRIVLPELTALYDAAVAGRPSPLPPTVQYRDYAAWQAAGPLDAELAEHLPWWREHLDGAPTLALPLDHPRPVEPRHAGTTAWFEVPAGTVAGLRATAQRRGATLFHVLGSAYALFLQGLSGQDEVVFATVVDRRRRREIERMVGYCLTPLPLRLRLPAPAPVPDVVDVVVDRVRSEMLDLLAHNVPFERIVGDLNPAHPIGASPVFQAMLVLEPLAEQQHPEWSMQQLDASVGGLLGHAKNDVHLELDERPDGHLSGRLIVNRDLFDPGFGEACVESFLAVVSALADC